MCDSAQTSLAFWSTMTLLSAAPACGAQEMALDDLTPVVLTVFLFLWVLWDLTHGDGR